MHRNKTLNIFLIVLLLMPMSMYSQENPIGSMVKSLFECKTSTLLSIGAVIPIFVVCYRYCNGQQNQCCTDELILAVRNNKESDVLRLLSQGVNVNVQDSNGYSLAHAWAIESNKNEKIMRLLFAYDLDLNMEDSDGLSPLHIAAAKGYEKAVVFLVKYGAKVDQVGELGLTPLHMISLLNGKPMIAQYLIDSGADVNSRTKNCGIKNALRDARPLHLAAKEGCCEMVELLLNSGAELDARDSDGRTALHYAAKKCHIKTLQCLVKKGACIDAEDAKGMRPLDYAVASLSWRVDHVDVVKFFIVEGACIDTTSLKGAILSGDVDILRVFIENGSDVNTQSDEGVSMLHWASAIAAENDSYIAEYSIKIIELLLEKGANVNITTKDGRTPLDVAENNTIKKVLRDAGAQSSYELKGMSVK